MTPHATIRSALATMIAPHAFIVMTGIAFPVLAPLAAPDIGIDRAYAGLFSAATFGVAAIAVLFGAMFVDRVGPVRAVQFSALCGVLGVACIALGTLPALAVAALFCGLSYAPPNPASSPVLLALSPPERRSSIFSLKQISVPLGGAVAGVTLPVLATWLGWQGALLFTAGAGIAIILAIEPWRKPIAEVVANGAARRTGSKSPISAMASLMSDPQLRAIGLMCFGFAALQYTFSSVFVVFLVGRAKLGIVDAGTILGIALFVSMFMRVFWGVLADRIGNAAVLLILGVTMAIAACVSVTVTAAWSWHALTLLAVCFAGAAYSWNGVYLAAVADVAGAQRIADATSSSMALVFVGGLAGPVFYSLIVYLTGDLGLGFGGLGLVAFLAGVQVCWALSRGVP